MNNLRVLVADDESKIRQAIGLYLKKEGYEVGEAKDGAEAFAKFNAEPWDIIILDIMMPKMDGVQVCQEIRKTSMVPIIMLTAKNEEVDRILGLELGADDYMGKPFSPRELIARIKAVYRRMGTKTSTEENILKYPELKINLLTREVFIMEQQITLTLKEFELFSLLARSPGQVFSREQLLEKVWGIDYYGDSRCVDTHINRLRDKLKVPNETSFISTVWGIGYKFEINK
ncbi:response regulator transcription factor [Clostridium formicaceticum]|uniref:Stage 0 sporulation protein A homolog n=1 Tax=Clostridium formicaceticum TaxID=1497 RepID=A0AAC9RNB0_9CLOT|nr:response regulator transcription factor [Clostridium formicaceticum]AOY77753.1 DNA-binding response regulator [Clostridium formicaceticum]ARE88353.1 Transcriptional regulatory protein SrrA [Clostridium formicaceticum]